MDGCPYSKHIYLIYTNISVSSKNARALLCVLFGLIDKMKNRKVYLLKANNRKAEVLEI